MGKITKEFIAAVPKTDLHVHLDGSLRTGTLIELAKEQKVELPSYTEDGLRETVFKDRYKDLPDYLHGFAYTCAVLQNTEAIERVSYELAVDSFSEGVRYIEPRMAPQLLVNNEQELPAVLQAMDRGYRRATDEFNQCEKVKSGEEPPYAYGILVCAMRMFNEHFSRYYKNLWDVHSYSPEKSILGMASMEMARAAVSIRDELGVAIVGFDIAGQEKGYPAHFHRDAYNFCQRNFLRKTVHAGEAYGPESIFEAITDLNADRIGHGYYLFEADKIVNPRIEDREAYIHSLAEYIADHRVTIEVCLTSNLQTNPGLESLKDHPLRKMLDAKISATLATDNRLMSWTSVSNEIQLAVDHCQMTAKEMRQCVFNGFKRSFMPLDYLEKRQYVRKVIDFYNRLEKEHGVS